MKLLLIIPLLFFSTSLFSQQKELAINQNEKAAITIGVFQGGGSIFGFDLEFLLYKRIGIQAGAGLLGYGAGLNFHFKPSIRSSFLSIQYWQQGLGSSLTQNAIGPNIVYRGKKWFTFQLGMGALLSKQPWPIYGDQGDLVLMLAIGGYIPTKMK